MIEANIIHAAHATGVAKLLFLGSSLHLSELAPTANREEALLTGPLEPTNQWYAIAKIAGHQAVPGLSAPVWRRFHLRDADQPLRSRRQFRSCNSSHVIPALIRKAHEAKVARADDVVLWGTGPPRREFLHVDDLADALVLLMQTYSRRKPCQCRHRRRCFHRRSGRRSARASSASRARSSSIPPSRTGRRASCSTFAAHALGWRASIPLEAGIAATYGWFLNNGAEA